MTAPVWVLAWERCGRRQHALVLAVTTRALKAIGLFRLLRLLSQYQMVAHCITRCFRTALTDSAVHMSMHLRRLFQVLGAVDGLSSHVEKDSRHHIHKRSENAIAGSGGYSLMKAHIVNKELLRVIKRGEHPGNLFRQRGQVIAGSSLGRETRDGHLKRLACFKHFAGSESMQGGH